MLQNFQNHKYLGIDFDGNHIKASKFKQKEFKLITKDLREEWFFGEFDFVWSSEVIEHIMDDNSFFSKLVKSTKKNGYIIIPDKNTVIEENDEILFLCMTKDIKKAEDLFKIREAY